MKNFYQSDYYSWLETNDPKMVKNVEDALYEDPDNCDVELYKDLSLKYDLECKKCNLFVDVNNQKIKMSADIVCGVKRFRVKYARIFVKLCQNQIKYKVTFHMASA